MNKTNIKSRGFKALLVTQFLGAFNDNAFKLVIAFIAVDRFVGQAGGSKFLALAGALFSLPFLLFSNYAGYLADHLSKQRIIVWVKVMEIAVMVLGLFALLSGNMWFLLSVLFLMGAQSALFSPSKYGILPEILDPHEISEGNGLIQMWTFAAIILGQACGGLITQISGEHVANTAYVFILIAVTGTLTSLGVTKVQPSGARRDFEPNFFNEFLRNISLLRKDIGMFRAVLGLMVFGFLGGIFHLNILLYARRIMGVEHFPLSLLLIILAAGIGTGSFLAGKCSNRLIELGFVPLGAAGLSVFSVGLGFVYHTYLHVAVCLFLLGVSAGFYIIPLNAFIQRYAPADRKGQILATSNILSCLSGLFASVMIYVFKDVIQLNSAQIFVVLGLVTSVGAVYVCCLLPRALVRLIVWTLTHTLYRIRVVGRSHIPEQGGALLVSNHVALVDALLILVSTDRPVRFLVSRNVYRKSIWGPLLKLADCIPVEAGEKPKQIAQALRLAREAVTNGELVCIFAEGQLTRTGNLLKFQRGLEVIMKGLSQPVIPVHIDRIWGSVFSYEGGRYYTKVPKIIPYPITVSVGQALPARSTAFQVRRQVMELGSNAFQYRLADKMTLSEAFYKEARKHPFRQCVADSSGVELNYGKTLISAVALSGKLEERLAGQKHVGIMLPPSVAGVLANIAVSFLNKVPVNLNYTTSKESLSLIMEQCGMKSVITSRKFLDKTGLEVPGDPLLIEDIVKKISGAERFRALVRSFIIPIFMANRIIFKRSHQRSLDDLATIMFTSGSTGTPKGVMLTHFNVISNLEGLYQVFRMREREVFMGVLPFFHSFGFTATLWLPLISGASAVYHANPLDAKMIGKLVEKHKATVMKATPTFLNAYTRRCTSEQFRSLRIVVVGAEKLKSSIAEAFQEKFGLEPMEGYGCTELSPIVSLNLPDYTGPGGRQRAHKPGSIGQPLPGIAVKIVDPNTMEDVPEGEAGMLLVKGPNVMKGYLHREDLTREVIRDGWYITGDIVRIDPEGFITITDRLSRFSKIGGEMVPHIKIEEAMHSILKTTEQKCVVTSVPDEKKGERLAVICLQDVDVPALLDGLKDSGLPNLWIPSQDSFCKIDEIPLLGTGKLDLGQIRKIAKDALGGAP